MFKTVMGSLASLALGYSAATAYVTNTKPGSKLLNRRELHEQNLGQVEKLESLPIYQSLIQNEGDSKNEGVFTKIQHSEIIPKNYRINHVGQGLLFNEDIFNMDPVIFLNEKKGELVGFYGLGKSAIVKGSNDEKTDSGFLYKGIVNLLLDEGLCYCGFSQLPNKKGVTGRLNLQYSEHEIKGEGDDQSVLLMLQAKVTEVKNRRAIIKGEIFNVGDYDTKGAQVLASGECVLVEPKWFKYIKFIDFF